MNVTKIMTVEEMSDRTKWLEMRRKGIGGSEAGIILGVNKWKSQYALWLEKTGQITVEESEEADDYNESIHFGNILEQVVADEFSERTGKRLKKCGLLQSNEHPFMFASVDRLVVGENAGLECKTASSWKAEEWEDDKIPDSYLAQVVHYLAATGADRWYIAVLIGGNKFVWKTIERDEEDIKALIDLETEWWQKYVVEKGLPPVDDTKICTEALNSFHNFEERTEPKDLLEFDSKLERLEEIKANIKELKSQQTQIENELRLEMIEHAFGSSFNYNVWYKYRNAPSKSFDKERFDKDYPNLYDKYILEKPVRVLKVKRKAGK